MKIKKLFYLFLSAAFIIACHNLVFAADEPVKTAVEYVKYTYPEKADFVYLRNARVVEEDDKYYLVEVSPNWDYGIGVIVIVQKVTNKVVYGSGCQDYGYLVDYLDKLDENSYSDFNVANSYKIDSLSDDEYNYNETLSTTENKKDEFTRRADTLKDDYEKSEKEWMTQYEMNIGSGEYREKWDLLLNEVYNYLQSTLSSTEFKLLKDDEIKWIEEKEKAIEEAEKEWNGGSAQPWAMNAVDIDYTYKRVYYLISLIEDLNSKNKITVLLNGKELLFDEQPYIENGATRVPMRKIFEALGATVEYEANTKTITAIKGSTIIELAAGASTAKINGREITLTASVENKNGSTMVPLRFVSEALGAEVIWDGENKVITINLQE